MEKSNFRNIKNTLIQLKNTLQNHFTKHQKKTI